jgi:hypothetical protein
MTKPILAGVFLSLVLMATCKRQQGPSLSETLSWLTQTYNPHQEGFGGHGQYLSKCWEKWLGDYRGCSAEDIAKQFSTRETLSFKGCQVTHTIKSTLQTDHGLWETFNLRDIDPHSIQLGSFPDILDYQVVAEVEFSARNDAEALVYSGNIISKGVRSGFAMDDAAYAGQFAEAFRHAVELCGGRPSTFPWLGQRGGEVRESPAPPPNSAAASAQELFKRVSPSVFVVEGLDANGSGVVTGSGVALDPDDVVTNKHVIEGGMAWRIKHDRETWSATVKRFDPSHDLCELNTAGLNAPAVLVRSSSSLAVGERVYAIGAPEGLELTLSEGVISSLRAYSGGRIIQTSAAVSPGSSGGGLFDAQGRLVGITTFSLKESQNLNFALPTEWVQTLAGH